MLSLLKNHPRAVLWAIIVHVIFLIAMGVSFHFIDAPSVASSEVKVVKAILMDDSIEQRKLKKKLAKQRKAAERKRKQELKKEKARLKKLKDKARLKKKKEAQIAADKKRIEEENKRQIEAENKRREKEREQQKRDDKFKKEMEQEQQRLAAEQTARNETIISKQLAIIKGYIEQRWIKPASAKFGMVCIVKVSLIPSGEVINVQYIKRSGNAAFDQSVYTAVKRSSPLPLPRVEYGLSDRFREIDLKFGQQ